MINAIGCLVLAAVVFTQWSKESRVGDAMAKLHLDIAEARILAEKESRRATDLERDIAVLKQSFEATRQAAVVEQRRQGVPQMREQVDEARDQVENWKTAMASRDTRIRELEADLTHTRRRLDEAVVRLKQAGAR